MGLWLVALVLIVLLVARGTIATRRRRPAATHGWAAPIPVRLVGSVLVTGAIAVAARTLGPLAAAVTGVVGVAGLVWLLVQTGYWLPVPRR